jgi:hypothetical protein
MVETDTAVTGDSKQRTRRMLAALTIGLLVVGVLVAYGFSRSTDDRPSSSTSTVPTPTIGIIQAPALVDSTRPVVQGSSPATADVPVAPPPGTNDIIVPPGTADIAVPPGATVIVSP